jgi:chromosome segregation ATPase
MSEKWKAEAVQAIEGKIRELEAQRAAHVGTLGAAQQAARRAQSDIEATDNHLADARAELEAARAV